MSLLSDLIDLNLSESTVKLITEYLWIGGSGMDLRSKARTLPGPVSDPTKLPKWNYDGSSINQASAGDDSDSSSTNQASAGDDSEVILHPHAIFKDPFRRGHNILVICDEYTQAGGPIPTNKSHNATKIFSHPDVAAVEPWYGIELEYILLQKDTKWPLECYGCGFPGPQGPYYCGVGADKVFGSDIVDAHHKDCLYAGSNNSGVNVEVMPWQFDWNGAGAHCNYSTTSMRNDGFVDVVKKAIEDLSLPGYMIHDFTDEDIGIKIAEHTREIQWPMWTVSHLLSSSPMEKVMSYYRASKVADNLNDEVFDPLADKDLRCFLEERLSKEKAGLSEKILTTRLKTKVHVTSTEEENPDFCSICMVGYKEHDKIACLYYCRHEYHAECIKEWLFKANLCPICRALAIIPEDYPCWDADVQLHQAFFAHSAFGKKRVLPEGL